MDSNNLISSLVETYKVLNINFRTATETPAAREIVTRMRDDEIAFSQALKDQITGVGTDDGQRNEVVDGADETLAHIISQFGTARATTLNLLKGIQNDAAWDAKTENGKSIRENVQDLVTSDANQIQKLQGEVPG